MEKRKPNYKVFFPMGVSFIGVGIVFMTTVNPGLGAAFLGLGVTWMILGLVKSMEAEKEDESHATKKGH